MSTHVVSTQVTNHLSIARHLASRPGDWPVEPRFDPVHRWFHRLQGTDEPHGGFEAWLLTWLPGQETDLHDHGGSAGAFVVVDGTLTERTLRGEGIRHSEGARQRLIDTRLVAEAGRSFGSHHIHQITNQSDRPAISLHVYGPALTTMTRYHLLDGVLRVLAVDRAGAQW